MFHYDAPAGAVLADLLYPDWATLFWLVEGEPWSMSLSARDYDPAPGLALIGPTSQATRVLVRPSRAVELGLTPLGWRRLFRRSASHYADRVNPLEQLIGADAAALAEAMALDADADRTAAMLDDWLLRRLEATPEVSGAAFGLCSLIASGVHDDVAELSADLGLSPRHVWRLSQQVLGLSPKLVLQRRRFMRTLLSLREQGGPWGKRLDSGYHDQSQFVRDCRQFLGMTASEFFGRPRPLLDASTLARRQLFGVQALYP